MSSTNARLDTPVLDNQQPAEDWAKSTTTALGATTTESSSVPGQTSHVVQPHETALGTTATPQTHVDSTLGTSSVASTPGVQVPGAWTDMPATANQIVTDAGNALAQVGSAVYAALPDSVKEAVSPSTTNDSPIQTTTNHSTTSPTSNLAETASSAATKAAELGTAAAATAAAGAGAVYEKATASTTAGVDKSAEVMPAHQTATLPSQEISGQQPLSGPMDGVGALPGGRDETGVAILPEDKDALANKSTSTATQTTTGTAPAPTLLERAQGAATIAAATATDAYNNPHEYVPGMVKPANDGNTRPYHQNETLPSQDTQGQLPFTGEQRGVGALPGGVHEEGVAVLPEEKTNPNPLNPNEGKGESTNKTLADPYNSSSPYSDTKANEIGQPSSGATGTVKAKAEEVKEKVVPSKNTESSSTPTPAPAVKTASHASSDSGSPTSPTKKAGFMDKLKGQSKILSGKLSKNEEKIAEGQALKSGSTHA